MLQNIYVIVRRVHTFLLIFPGKLDVQNQSKMSWVFQICMNPKTVSTKEKTGIKYS